MKSYDQYLESKFAWIGKYPKDWDVKPLKHLVITRITDGPHETPEFFDEGVPFVSAEAIENGTINFAKVRGYITDEADKVYSLKCKPKADDVFLVKSGSTTGKIAIVTDKRNFNIWSPIALIRANSKVISKFLFYSLTSDYFQNQIKLFWSFGTQPNIGMGVIENLKVILPPIYEQKAIVTFLDKTIPKIDELIAKKNEFIERLKEKRTALISQVVTKGLPPEEAKKHGLPISPKEKSSGVDWLGEIPEHWATEKFSRDIAIAEGQVDPSEEPYSGMILIAPDHIEARTGRLIELKTAQDQNAESGKYLVRKNDVVYSKIRPALQKVCISPVDGLCSADMYPLRSRKKVTQDYLYWILLTQQFGAWSMLESERVAMPKINRETLSKLWLPIPPHPEQEAISSYLTDEIKIIDDLSSAATTAIEVLNEYRSSLITSAVTGEIDVRETTK